MFIGFFISENGTLAGAFIKEASLYPEMDSIILNAFKETRAWKPSTAHGRRRTFTGVKCFSYLEGKVIRAKDMYY